MSVFGYIRVSTSAQAEEGLSLDAQERQVQGYALMRGIEVTRVFVERGVSGARPMAERSEGRRLLSEVRAGDVIICPKLDRMFRSARDALDVSDQLKKRGVSLHLLDLGGDITGNGISKVFFTIVAAFAEFERDRIAERVADVKANERAKNRYLGGAKPFGYRVTGGQLAPSETEQQAIARAKELRKEGRSLRQIATELRSLGLQVSHVTVRRLLTQE